MIATTHVEVAIVGGGQAGLAAAHELGRRGVDPLVLDAAPETGHSWRTRWDSLRLFTPAAFCGLPGLAFPAPPWHHPTKDEVADYLQTYARTFDLPVRHQAPVSAVDAEAGGFRLAVADGMVTADGVVLATGPFQQPVVPALAHGLAPEVVQLHSSDYRRPEQLPTGTVLVVGAGNSGVQIAAELAATHRVHLAVGQRGKHVPQTILGRDLFWWLTRAGMLTAEPGTRRAARMLRTELVIGQPRRGLAQRGITSRDRVTAADGGRVEFADGSSLEVDAVVWATGFRAEHGLVRLPGALDERGLVRQRSGIGQHPGLYTIGQPWQRNRGSALLGFVGDDAARLADHIAHDRRTARRQPAGAH